MPLTKPHKKKYLLILIIIFLGCAPSVFKPTASDVEAGKLVYSDLTFEQLNEGCKLYANKCGSCHTLFKPKGITRDRWTQVLPAMKIKAKLGDAEFELISRYLKAKLENSQ